MPSWTTPAPLYVYLFTQVRELPLAVDFINVPTGFDTSSLNYSLSQETMLVAGPTRTVSALTELSVVSFDLASSLRWTGTTSSRWSCPAAWWRWTTPPT